MSRSGTRHLPDRWKTVLATLLRKDPQQRYPSWEELGSQLRTILPIGRSPARALGRATAWLLDFAIIALLSFLLTSVLGSLGMPSNLSAVGLFPAPIAYTLREYWKRRSIGHELVHIQIVNQYGLPPSRQKVLLRSCMRMQAVWCIVFGTALGPIIPYADSVVPAIGVLLTAADGLYMLFAGRGTSLHDRIVRTQAIVESETH